MIKPKPFKIECAKCSFSKIVAPKSDALMIGEDMPSSCPKCDGGLKRAKLDVLEKVFVKMFK